MTNKLIAQGAEAKIFLDLNEQTISKQRVKKSYRHPVLDEQLRKSRTKKESKILAKAASLGINVPKIIKTEKYELTIEFIQGDKLSETLNSYNKEKQFQIMQQLGEQTAKLHENNIIHSDLTTSNIILEQLEKVEQVNQYIQTNQLQQNNIKKESINKKSSFKVFLIDFGLSFISTKIEDKAVDIHLLKQALEAKHFQNHKELFQNFLKGYNWKESEKVLERLKKVEKRGRYKH